MKAIYLFALIALVFGQTIKIDINDDVNRGCKIPEGRDQCCWLNNNGCCKPPQLGQLRTMALTTCCKKRVCDEKTRKCTYTYSRGSGSSIGIEVM